jgi:hypothetical protein
MRRAFVVGALAAACASATVGVNASASSRRQPAREPVQASVAGTGGSRLMADVLAARLATAKYATNLSLAKADGYQIITRMIPDMGYHYLNPKVTGFDVRKPPILVYEHHGSNWQLGALEWVFTSMPSRPPLPGARYGSFPAACHYVDGTFVPAATQAQCAPRSPETGAAFNFWHPRLITLHFWIWYPNPSGLYMGMNPMVAPFNAG